MHEEQAHTENPTGSSPFKMILTLSLAGLFSGLVLASTFIWTQPIIEQNRIEATQAAVYEVLPGCDSTQVWKWNGSALEETENLNQEYVIYQGWDEQGNSLGYAIPASIAGFQDIITGMFGYDPELGKVIGLKILESKETPGLGDKIFKDPEFQENFASLNVTGVIEYVKKGEKLNDNQVEGITGATISSKAVTQMLVDALEVWKERLEK